MCDRGVEISTLTDFRSFKLTPSKFGLALLGIAFSTSETKMGPILPSSRVGGVEIVLLSGQIAVKTYICWRNCFIDFFLPILVKKLLKYLL